MLTFNWCILNHRPSHPLNARNSLQQDYPLIYKFYGQLILLNLNLSIKKINI